ncbi:hypothetical protein K493DRAFT_321089 [Basidiobolus meristosporus CBS 931.73]|uniref:Tricalbin n=1 Tax=Basidiobolus meristosporus CBS 931.73 TaxID=1314790 RepID=A0A1Y1X011_9FUNG|nr:hypothetical protein K493DRAFT_321089 [Basidiobolus meristosporus CBS 931.73]|eukprot:ORX79169.1 hypothetical protein K493DRAFT_321089 [Basidiobolus meristosporus CBS 931.73]
MSNEAGLELNQPIQPTPPVSSADAPEKVLPSLPAEDVSQATTEPEVSTEQRVAEARVEADQIMSDSKAPVHTFDPHDTPEEKARKAKEAAGVSDVTVNNPLLDGPSAKTLITESSKPAQVNEGKAAVKPKKELPPPVLGWRESNADYISKYSGQEWQNYIAIVTLVLGGFLVSRLYFGFGWCLIVIAFGTQYYANSVQRHRRNVRDDITRQLATNKLFQDAESTEWLNSFVSKFWLIYEPVLSATVVEIGDGVLAENTPGFLDSLRLSHFTLGTKAPRVDSVKTLLNDDEDKVEMEWEFSFTPNDIMDLTKRELEKKTNPKICLEIRVGKGFVGAGMPVLVEDFAFKGRMRIALHLMSTFPHVKTVDVSFMEPPVIDYVLKPLGGDTFGFDIAHIPGLQTFIRDQTNAILGPMMYAPNVFTLDVEQLMSGVDMDAAVGVLKVNVRSARNLKNLELIGMSDPYVVLRCNGRAELARTSVKDNTVNPVWDETYYILLHSIADALNLEIYDKEDVQKDRSLGTVSFDLSSLSDSPEQSDILGKVIREGGKQCGELLYDVSYFPVVPPIKNEDGTESPVESNSGVLKVFIHQAKDLPSSNAYGVVKLNNNSILKTQVIKKKSNPLWEKSIEMFISDKESAVFGVDVLDESAFTTDPVIGNFNVSLAEAIERNSENPWYNLNGSSGKVRMSFVWRPVVIKGGVLSAGRLAPPIGAVRLELISAKKLKNTDLIGKADPYVIVSVANKQKARTEVIEDNLNPIWNETHFIGVRNPRETFVLEVYNWDNYSKDTLMGSTSINVSELLGPQVAEGYYGEGEVKEYEQVIQLENKDRGTIHFKAHFYPIDPIARSEEKHEEEVTTDKGEINETAAVEKLEETAPEPIDYTRFSTGLLSLDTCFAEYNKKVTDPIFNEECEAFVQESLFTKISIARTTIPVPDILDLLTKSNSTESSWYEFENHAGKIQLAFNITNKASNLASVDSSGFSDPFVRVKVNDEKVFKSKTIKKNLNPEFNEEFTAPLMARNQDVFLFEIFDWNQFQSQELLGKPMVECTKDLTLRLLFTPEHVGTLGGAALGGAATVSVVGGTFEAGKFVVGGTLGAGKSVVDGTLGAGKSVVGGTLGAGKSVVGGTLGAGKSVKKSEHGAEVNNPSPVVAPAVTSIPVETSVDSIPEAASDFTADSGPETFGTESTVVDGQNVSASDSNSACDPYIKVRWGRKVLHKTKVIKKTLTPVWNEHFTLPTNGSRVRLHFSVRDHNLLQDSTLGEFELDVWDRVHPASNVMSDEFIGHIKLRIDFTPEGGMNSSIPLDAATINSEASEGNSKKKKN